ncbi:homeobox protein luminidependens isoform X2, partial [Tanacetum coccineum]
MGAIHPYLGGASLHRVCSHGGSDTLLSGSRLANLSQKVSKPVIYMFCEVGGSGRRDEVVAHIFYLLRKEETYNGQAKLTEWILQMPNDVVLYWFLTNGGVMILASWPVQAAIEEQCSQQEIKVEWGNGLAQEREAEEARTEEMELQKTKLFARTRDDPVIERMLKEKEFAVAVCRSIKSGHTRRETTATDSELRDPGPPTLSTTKPSQTIVETNPVFYCVLRVSKNIISETAAQIHGPSSIDTAAGINTVAPQRLNTEPEVITSGPSANDHPRNDPWHGLDHGALK